MGSTLGPSGVVWPLGTPHLTPPPPPPPPPTSSPTQVKTHILLFGGLSSFRSEIGEFVFRDPELCKHSDDKVGLGKKKIPSQSLHRSKKKETKKLIFSSDSPSECSKAFSGQFGFWPGNNRAFCFSCQCYNCEK